jgi:hypothetical protein
MHGNQIIPVVYRVSSGNPESSTIQLFAGSLQNIYIAVLQQLIRIYYIRVEERKYYKPFIQVLQTIHFNFSSEVG